MIILLHVALSISSHAPSPVFFLSHWQASFHRVFRSSCFPWFIRPWHVPQYLFFIFPHHNPYRFSRLSVTILEACVTLVVSCMCSFLILSLRVTPHMMSNLRSIPSVFHTGESWCLYVIECLVVYPLSMTFR